MTTKPTDQELKEIFQPFFWLLNQNNIDHSFSISYYYGSRTLEIIIKPKPFLKQCVTTIIKFMHVKDIAYDMRLGVYMHSEGRFPNPYLDEIKSINVFALQPSEESLKEVYKLWLSINETLVGFDSRMNQINYNQE